MIFATPWALWLLLALPIVVGAFLYRKKVPVITVPSLAAWLSIGEPVQAFNFKRFLKRLLALALELAVVALLVLGAANPVLQGKGTQSVILVLDASATMQIRESGNETRFDLARKRATEILVGLPRDCDVRVVIASDVPQALPFSASTPVEARSAISELQAQDLDSDLSEAFRLACSLVTSNKQSDLYVISDFAAAEPGMLRESYHGSATLHLESVGRDKPNAGIQHAWCESAPNHRLLVHVTLQQRGVQQVPVSLLAGDQRLASSTCTFKGSTAAADFDVPTPDGAPVLQVRLDASDALELDNHFYIRSVRVARTIDLVSDGNRPLEAVLRSSENTLVRVIRPQEFKSAGDARVVVFDRVRPGGLHPEPGVSYLFIGAADPFHWVEAGDTLPPAVPSSWAAGHPVLQDLTPTAMPSQKTIAITPAGGVQVRSLMTCGDAPLLVEVHNGSDAEGGRMLYFLSDPFATSFPGTLGFPVLMLNAMDYLAQGDAITAPFLRTGQMATLNTPRGLLRLPRFERAGVHRVDTPTGQEQVAVNYVSSRAMHPLPPGEARSIAAAAPKVLSHWPSLSYLSGAGLIIAGLALAVLEFVLYHRGRLHVD